MALEELKLSTGQDLINLNIASGTQISTRTADIVRNLKASPAKIVRLSTKSRNAGKLISIVEIAKRELKAQGVEVFQYNALSSETVEVERKKAGVADGARDVSDDDDAFETMGAKELQGMKKRVVPVMTTYLSTESVAELKARFGYVS